MTAEQSIDMVALVDELSAASSEFTLASEQEELARVRVLDCLNRLNKAQRAVDDAMDLLRSRSSVRTDWGLERLAQTMEVPPP